VAFNPHPSNGALKLVTLPDRTAAILHNFGHLRPVYESLVNEVLFAVHKGLSTRSIKTATVFGRVKEPQSLADKIDRMNYTNLSDITDLAGARIVCMYSSQLVAVENFIREEFKVIEHLDKSDQLGADRMGYQGLHFLIELAPPFYEGPRYRSLRGLRCELQVRTVLQDAWALISHQLVYKNEEVVPKRLLRDLNNVSSLLEIAQSVFDSVEEKRAHYMLEIQERFNTPDTFLSQPIDYETVTAYSRWKFPGRAYSDFWQARLLQDLDLSKYRTLKDLDEVVERANEAVAKYRDVNPHLFQFSTDFITKSLGFVDLGFRQRHPFGQPTKDAFEQYGKLVKRAPRDRPRQRVRPGSPGRQSS
jgi:putative GTP pyrophosphokinase